AQALAAGDIQIGNMGLGNFIGLAQSGKLKLLAVSAPQRSPLAPDAPTFAEAGLNAYPGRGWWGLAAPKGTPQPIIDRLNAEFVKLFREPKFLAFLEQQAVVAAPGTPAEFAAFVKEDRRTAEALIKLANTPREEYKPGQRGAAATPFSQPRVHTKFCLAHLHSRFAKRQPVASLWLGSGRMGRAGAAPRKIHPHRGRMECRLASAAGRENPCRDSPSPVDFDSRCSRRRHRPARPSAEAGRTWCRAACCAGHRPPRSEAYSFPRRC